jgi:hypothetical protein
MVLKINCVRVKMIMNWLELAGGVKRRRDAISALKAGHGRSSQRKFVDDILYAVA